MYSWKKGLILLPSISWPLCIGKNSQQGEWKRKNHYRRRRNIRSVVAFLSSDGGRTYSLKFSQLFWKTPAAKRKRKWWKWDFFFLLHQFFFFFAFKLSSTFSILKLPLDWNENSFKGVRRRVKSRLFFNKSWSIDRLLEWFESVFISHRTGYNSRWNLNKREKREMLKETNFRYSCKSDWFPITTTVTLRVNLTPVNI
jgi:hypothetical protein